MFNADNRRLSVLTVLPVFAILAVCTVFPVCTILAVRTVLTVGAIVGGLPVLSKIDDDGIGLPEYNVVADNLVPFGNGLDMGDHILILKRRNQRLQRGNVGIEAVAELLQGRYTGFQVLDIGQDGGVVVLAAGKGKQTNAQDSQKSFHSVTFYA